MRQIQCINAKEGPPNAGSKAYIEYLVDKGNKSSWVTKEEAINLAIEGRLHAIIVHLKNGSSYLRPEYGNHPFTRVA